MYLVQFELGLFAFIYFLHIQGQSFLNCIILLVRVVLQGVCQSLFDLKNILGFKQKQNIKLTSTKDNILSVII